jgi:hypothetical protein
VADLWFRISRIYNRLWIRLRRSGRSEWRWILLSRIRRRALLGLLQRRLLLVIDGVKVGIACGIVDCHKWNPFLYAYPDNNAFYTRPVTYTTLKNQSDPSTEDNKTYCQYDRDGWVPPSGVIGPRTLAPAFPLAFNKTRVKMLPLKSAVPKAIAPAATRRCANRGCPEIANKAIP